MKQRRKWILILCMIITFQVMIFSAHAENSFSFEDSNVSAEFTPAKLTYGVSPISSPADDSKNPNIPQIILPSSFSSLPSTLYIQVDQEIKCLFEIFYEVSPLKHFQAPISVASNHFFFHLFRVIISPNAP